MVVTMLCTSLDDYQVFQVEMDAEDMLLDLRCTIAHSRGIAEWGILHLRITTKSAHQQLCFLGMSVNTITDVLYDCTYE